MSEQVDLKQVREVANKPIVSLELINELRQKHDELCDILIKYGAVQDDQDGHAYEGALHNARIDTGDTNIADQAWDEPTNGTQEAHILDGSYSTDKFDLSRLEAQDETVAPTAPKPDVQSVDAIMGQLMTEISWSNTYKLSKQRDSDETFGVGFLSAYTIRRICHLVRPHIEKLVRERNNFKQIASDECLNAISEQATYYRDCFGNAVKQNDLIQGHLDTGRKRAEKAEAEVARLREEMGKCVHMAKDAGYGTARTMADALLKALAEGNGNE